MFYFVAKIILYFLFLFLAYHILARREIMILETIILLFIFEICWISLEHNFSILITIFLIAILFAFYYLYLFLRDQEQKEGLDNSKVLINRGVINFHELMKENYTYDSFLLSLKKHGVSNPDCVDYCIKKDRDLIIFKKNSVKNYPISLIIDGEILKDNLFSIHKSIEWLKRKLDEEDLTLKKVNYAYYKGGNIHFITS